MSAPRPPVEADLLPLTTLWAEGWHEAHAAFVPADLVAHRTEDSFRTRLRRKWKKLRVTGPEGAPTGFCAIHDDELDQLFVSSAARGTGAAAQLLADAEERLAASGVTRAFLLCLPENDRARRFYERHGWVYDVTRDEAVETLAGPFTLRTAIYRKALTPR